MTHLLLGVLIVLEYAGIGVVDATAVVNVVDAVGVEMLFECPPKTVCPLTNMCLPKVLKPLLLFMYPLIIMDNLLNLSFHVDLALLCLNSLILFISKLCCKRSLSWIRFFS